jgi:Taurine catabolism dioxygenase TauD, TfdA family
MHQAPAAILYIDRVIAMCQQCPNWTLLNFECPPVCWCWRSPLRLFGRELPLRAGFAAELRGVGLIDVVSSDAAYLAVREAFEEHSVVLFRNQDVGDDVQVAFSRAFGPLQRTEVGSLAAGTLYVRVTNVAADGSLSRQPITRR